MGKIYYLMGKSASGKDHIYEHLIQETALDLKPFVLYTTRPIRSGEQDGREYFFVDEKRLSRNCGRPERLSRSACIRAVHGTVVLFYGGRRAD